MAGEAGTVDCSVRRATLAVSAFSLLLAPVLAGVSSARAQTEEDAARAESEANAAYSIVEGAESARDGIEAELFGALQRYDLAASALAEANRRVAAIEEQLESAGSEEVAVDRALSEQAAEAYMGAVTSVASIVLGTKQIEAAIVLGDAFRSSQTATLARLDELAALRAEYDRLLADHTAARDETSIVQSELESEAATLETLFAQANEAVAGAFQQALEADAAYRAALDAVATAQAEAEAEERADSAATTSSTTGTTSPTPSPPPTSDPSDPPPPAPVGDAVERWHPLVEVYFPAELVEDALLIIDCESGGDPEAYNPYLGASGLFQFLPGTWAVASVGAGMGARSVFDGEANIAAAAWLSGYYASNGSDPWAPWGCRYVL